MKSRHWLSIPLVFLLVISSLACRLFLPQAAPDFDPAAEEQAVYQSLFSEPAQFLALRAETSASIGDQAIDYDFFDGAEPALKKATYEDFIDRNQQAVALKDYFKPGVPHVFLTEEERRAFFDDPEQDGWAEFFEAYPQTGGIIGLSRVGFDPAGTQALVYQDFMGGYLYGSGYYILFEKEDGQWIERWRLMAWIS